MTVVGTTALHDGLGAEQVDLLAVAGLVADLNLEPQTLASHLVNDLRAVVDLFSSDALGSYTPQQRQVILESRDAVTTVLRRAQSVRQRSTEVFHEVGTRSGLPVLSWAPTWWPLMEEFAASATGALTRAPNALGLPALSYPIDRLPDGLNSGIRDFAAALAKFELPEGGAVLLSGITALLGSSIRPFFAVIAGMMRDYFADDVSAMNIPVLRAGLPDGTFPLHCDLFPPRLLCAVYERPSSSQGVSLLARCEDYLETVGPLLSESERIRLTDLWSFGWSSEPYDKSLYGQQEEILMAPSRRAAAEAAVEPVTLKVHFGPGEGYLVKDGVWMHGRTWMDMVNSTDVRMHRLSYDNLSTFRARRSGARCSS